MIEFLCPNGHKIQCGDSQAGKRAKCPRCGAMFLVPQKEDASLDGPVAEAAAEPAGVGQRRGSREPQIEFLCPNGHRLHGPASLQGRLGQCPDCGSRFRIPIYDEGNDDEQAELGIEMGRADGRRSSDSRITPPEISFEGSSRAKDEDEDEQVPDNPSDAMRTDISASDSALGAIHPLGAIFAKLWVEKARGATFELVFDDQRVLTPDAFIKTLSPPSHGVFAIKESNGTITLEAVAWEAVQRLVVRNLKRMPEGS